MSLTKKDARAKIEPEAHAVFAIRALVTGDSLERVYSDALNAAALGIGYRDKIAAERLARAGQLGRSGE